MNTPQKKPQVPAARNTLQILALLSSIDVPISAARIRRELGLPRSTTYHLLGELVDSGFAVHLPEHRTYGLGLAAYEMASAYATQQPLVRAAPPPAGTGGSSHWGIRTPIADGRVGSSLLAGNPITGGTFLGHRSRSAIAGAQNRIRADHACLPPRSRGTGSVRNIWYHQKPAGVSRVPRFMPETWLGGRRRGCVPRAVIHRGSRVRPRGTPRCCACRDIPLRHRG